MPPLQISKFEKGLLTFALLMSKVIVAILVAFVSIILWRWALVTVFESFIEKKRDLNKKNSPRLLTLSKNEGSLFSKQVLYFSDFTPSPGKFALKSDFLRMSRIGRQSRKIDFSFISPKHTFGWTYSRENSLKFQRFISRPKFKKVRNLHIMVFSGLKLSVRDLKNVWCLSSLISALVPEIFKFEKWVTYANEMTDDVIHST